MFTAWLLFTIWLFCVSPLLGFAWLILSLIS